MQKDQSDLELIFKKRARRRLVGAIALVLLMVILLPIVLEDRSESDVQQEIAIVMPDGSSTDEVIVSEEFINIEDLSSKITTKTEPLLLPKVEPVKPKENAIPKATVAVKPEPVAVVKPETQATVDNQKTAVKEVEKINSTPATNQFYVQIGVFSDIANVKKLQVKLNELGYQSVTEQMKTETGDKTRLRTKSFAGRNEAAIALKNIKDAGLTGMVVSQK